MDVWVVAAAAGAGLVVQRLKNLNVVRQDVPENSCPLRRVLLRNRSKNILPKEHNEIAEVSSSDEMDTTTDIEGENMVMPDNLRSSTSVSDANSLLGFLKHEDFEGDSEDRVPLEFEEVRTSDSLPQPSSRELGVSYGFRTNRSSIRSRRMNSHYVKPQTSLESCVMAQLYKEQGEIKEFTYSPDQSRKPIVRPFLVSDGRRIISRLPHESSSSQTETGKYKLLNDACHVTENKVVLGIPELPDVVLGESQLKAKSSKGKEKALRRNGSRDNGKKNLRGDGLPDKALVFYCGLTMGMISSFLANKRETEKLNMLLEKSENLVQDLQEELEMKDSLTVKELAMEHYESQDVHNDSYSDDVIHASSSHEQKVDNSSASPDQKTEEESLSRIEAELEAELERLESNMNSSRLEGKLSNVAELDPDFVSDIVEGELRADLFGAKKGKQAYADRDGSGNTTPHSLPYPVSPRELTLRLHELLQLRLEQRIKELELALENSQRKLKIIESSTTHNSPIAKDRQQNFIDQPVVINLTGEALSAYNEAYEELAKVSESDDEDPQVEFKTNGDRVQNGDSRNAGLDRDLVLDGNQDTVSWPGTEDYFRTRLNDVASSSMEESDDGEDEMERLLIRQIIEKAKQGSPAVLKAQKAFLLTQSEH